MNIGFMGLGKLGLPCALAIESKGHKVIGYDVSPSVFKIVRSKKIPYKEEGAQELLDNSNIKCVDIPTLVKESEIIFVAIQTPHKPAYEGITKLPKQREDFDYTYLVSGVRQLHNEIHRQNKETIVVIISTVLPGTIQRNILKSDEFRGIVTN